MNHIEAVKKIVARMESETGRSVTDVTVEDRIAFARRRNMRHDLPNADYCGYYQAGEWCGSRPDGSHACVSLGIETRTDPSAPSRETAEVAASVVVYFSSRLGASMVGEYLMDLANAHSEIVGHHMYEQQCQG